VLQTNKWHGLSVLIAHGMVEWVRQYQGISKEASGMKVQPHDPGHTVENLTILLANLFEPKI